MLTSFLTHNALRVVHHTVTLPRLPAGFEGYRIVQISDLHFYEYTNPQYYEGVVAQVNALAGDLLALTGDVIHYGDGYIAMAAEYLRRMTARDGKVAVIGNHDFKDTAGSAKVASMLGQTDFTVLRNAHLCLQRTGGDRLWLAGLDDYKHGRPNVDEALRHVPCRDEATLMLAHNPRLLDPIVRHPLGSVDLVLAGHTHAGHVFLPPLTPIYRYGLQMKYRYGFYRKGKTQLYVTSGVGSAAFYIFKGPVSLGFPRFRYNTQPEIAVLTLTAGT